MASRKTALPAASTVVPRARSLLEATADDWRIVIVPALLLLLLVAAAMEVAAPSDWRIHSLIAGFDLAREKNVAVWVSTLLLLTCAANFASFAADRTAGLRLPWVVLTAVFALLSLDEAGSLHERETSFDGGVGLGVMIAVAAILIALGAYSGLRLFAGRATRSLALLLAVAFALYASVVLQEFIEHRVAWPEWSRAPRVVMEEGAELLAGFLVLIGIARMRAGRADFRWSTIVPVIEPANTTRALLLGALALHVALSLVYLQTLSDLRGRGNPASWFPCLAFLLIAYRGAREAEGRPAAVGAALLCSAVAVIDAERWWPLSATDLSQDGCRVAATVALLALGWRAGRLDRASLPVVVALLTTCVAVLVIGNFSTSEALFGIGAYLALEVLVLTRVTTALRAPP